MSDSGRSSKIDETKLNKSQLDFMKQFEDTNRKRVEKLIKIRKSNVITGSLLGTGVLGIYLYSMWAVKQETFLDDFDPPKKVFTEPPEANL